MKRLLLFIVLLYSTLGTSQNFVMTWQHCYGGSENDRVYSIIPYKNGYLFFGYTKSIDGDVSNSCNEILNGTAWLVNIDARGEIIFDKSYCGFGGATGKKIMAIDSGFYLIGSTGPNHYGGVNGYWLAKADSSFNIVWQDVLGGSYVEDPRGGCIAHDGGVIECGLTGSPDGDIEESYGSFDNWLVKLNPDGSRGWIKTYANVGAEEGGHIIPTHDGGYILTGVGENFLPGNIYCEGHDNRMSEGWIIKIDADGEVLWHQCYGGSEKELLRGILELDDGFIISGTSDSDDYDLPGNYGEDTPDIWILKLDANGELVWSKNFGGSKQDYADHIFENDDSTYTIIGQTYSSNYDVQGNTNSMNSSVIWLMKINRNGDLIYQNPFPELTDLWGFYGVVKVSNYRYVIAATKNTWGCNYTQTNPSQDDIYVFEIQDMDEFIPSQAQGNSSVCLSTETETYYSTELVIDTMETQWLLLPEEAGEITEMHDSVLITWNPNFQDTAWLQVRAVNEYGESAYSTPKEIIVYPPLIIADITGPDSLCSATNTQTIFSTTIEDESLETNWYLLPETAGTILNQKDTAIITWNPAYEGQVQLKTGILNKCDIEEFSNEKEVRVRTCLGVSQAQTKTLKLYPNPATNQITFELPNINNQSHIQIKDVYGKVIATLIIKPNQNKLIWECSGVASGVYFYEGELSGEVYRGKIVVQ